MYKKISLLMFLLGFAQFFLAMGVSAADLGLTGSINGSYTSTGTIYTQSTCYVASTSVVTLTTPKVIALNVGFHIVLGGTLSVPFDSDNDGLRDSWEVEQFGNLSQTASGDYDGDGISNYLEFIMGFNSKVANIDHDSDGIPDWFEIKYKGNLITIGVGSCDCDE